MAMMEPDSQCPDSGNGNFQYMMNGMDVDRMCCTFSATLTRVGSSLGCCPCGARCTGSLPQVQNWYDRAGKFFYFSVRGALYNTNTNLGQVVLTTGPIPVSATSTASGGSATSASLGWESLTNWPLAAGSIFLTLLLAGPAF
jgi:hypothetical protein